MHLNNVTLKLSPDTVDPVTAATLRAGSSSVAPGEARPVTEHKLMTARLTRSIFLSDRTKHLEFQVENGNHFDFAAGQFVSVQEPRTDGKLLTRAYSLASDPCGDRAFALCLNRVDEGFMSNHLCDLPEGSLVRFHGPHGHFVLRDPLKDSIFVATGTGIAPFRGMVRWLFQHPERYKGHEFWLVYGTRYTEDIYYREEFEQIAREHPEFHYIITLSRGDDRWQGPRGYVQERIREIIQAHPGRELDAYICGLNQMVSSVRTLLKEEFGWDRKRIVYERYD